MVTTKSSNLATFYDNVKTDGKLRTTDHAQRWTRAVLYTLGDNLSNNAKKKLAGALPEEIGQHVTRAFRLFPFARDKEISLRDFHKQIALRSGNTDAVFAQFPTTAVFRHVKAMVSNDVVSSVADAIPENVRSAWENA